MKTPNKTIELPILSPRIESGASLGYSALDALSFSVGLMCKGGKYDRIRRML